MRDRAGLRDHAPVRDGRVRRLYHTAESYICYDVLVYDMTYASYVTV